MHRIHSKYPPKVLLEVKNLLDLRFLDNFSKKETEEYNQENCSLCDKFGIITPCSATYHLEFGAPVSLKAVTKACFVVSKAKKEYCDQKKDRVIVINLTGFLSF